MESATQETMSPEGVAATSNGSWRSRVAAGLKSRSLITGLSGQASGPDNAKRARSHRRGRFIGTSASILYRREAHRNRITWRWAALPLDRVVPRLRLTLLSATHYATRRRRHLQLG